MVGQQGGRGAALAFAQSSASPAALLLGLTKGTNGHVQTHCRLLAAQLTKIYTFPGTWPRVEAGLGLGLLSVRKAPWGWGQGGRCEGGGQ